MIFVYGADPFDRSPSSQSLNRALREAGFKLSEMTAVKPYEVLPDNCWVICFGSSAFKDLTGSSESITDARGQLWDTEDLTDVLVLPTYAPGYLYRNPNLMRQWKEDLALFKTVIEYG